MNLPLEILETLAYSNYYSPSPRPIDPAVFFDLVKIRRLIDDATSLSVRATNGTTSATLSNSHHGYLNGNDAEILGIGQARSGGGNARLSRERKFRMREHATSKLSHAYRLDEIAASVATMQSASALEEVAKHVLLRNEQAPDAQYVQFFHEKIPSRAMAENTSLKPLTDIINQRPTEASAYRTRAVTKIFKDDYLGAARDLTEALAVHRLYNDHRRDQREVVLARDAAEPPQGRLEEKDHPSSMEPQLLFHRAGVYLTLACQNIAAALKGFGDAPQEMSNEQDLPLTQSPQRKEEVRARMEARKLVRTYAKRALRDYTAFLSNFDYTPGASAEFTDAFLDRVTSLNTKAGQSRSERLLDVDSHSQNGISEALVRYERRRQRNRTEFPEIPRPEIYKVSELFNAVPPRGLPPFPTSTRQADVKTNPILSLPDFSEAVTYHPLMTDVLHSFLLCHCLVQTSTKELQRHAYMVARIARVCDGYPIFLAARSPARADWNEVLRRRKNWLGLEQTWEQLCTPSPENERRRRGKALSKDGYYAKRSNGGVNKEEKLECIKRDAIRDALADERVVDEDTFRTNVRAREARAIAAEDEEMRKEYHNINPSQNGRLHDVKPISGDGTGSSTKQNSDPSVKGKDYQITTERAEMIARWIREAPPPGSPNTDGTTRRKAGKGGRAGGLRKQASDMSAASNASSSSSPAINGLERSIESLDMID